VLERAADLYERHRGELVYLIVREGGRTVPDAVSELREAVDFLRYYAAQARAGFTLPRDLPGPTGGRNTLALAGRGVFACISPWNFPVAIFTGQVGAALAAGNAAMAKPAEQTPLCAALCIGLLHEAGVPREVLWLLPGDGRVGAALTRDPRVHGVAFTGSTEVAKLINRSLAAREGPIAPLIAETGGLNAMIVDSSALPEQVVADTLLSGFNSAGQRCSALRLLCVQDDVAPKILAMLRGAMEELVIGDPIRLATDVGPVIDAEAKKMLEAEKARLAREARPIFECRLPADLPPGNFVAPAAYEIDAPAKLDARDLRPRPACRALGRRPPRRARRRDQRLGLRADARRAQPCGFHDRAHRVAGARRQHLRQPQHDRRRRRHAAFRRRGAVRHGSQGRRPALSAPLRGGAQRRRGHHRAGRQRLAADLGREVRDRCLP
jgi:RHH-type transcriptional regulator, proline utilization regulon repressor / proline dehydrogenase / delta 1-pyrroline-5-carboxylate dehydrogenase